jgi:hypothetical protein
LKEDFSISNIVFVQLRMKIMMFTFELHYLGSSKS